MTGLLGTMNTWRRAAGEVSPIKTIPKYHKSPIAPAGPIPALDPELLVTSKVAQDYSAAVGLANSFMFSQAPGPPRRLQRPSPATETAQPSKVTLAASLDRKPWS